MSVPRLIAEIVAAVEHSVCVDGGEPRRLRFLSTPDRDSRANQFLLALKPELTAIGEGVRLVEVLDLVLSTLSVRDVSVGGIVVFPTPAWEQHDLTAPQYRTLHLVSHMGLPACSTLARDRLSRLYSEASTDDLPVLGAHQFLDANPEFSPLALETLARNVPIVKLGSGTYAIRIEVGGRPRIVLNPFHPRQAEHFAKGGRAFIALECTSGQSMVEIRNQLVGSVDPAIADPKSLRGVLFRSRRDFGLAVVSIAYNGFHISPGPLEGMFSVLRLFGAPWWSPIPLGATAFGASLLAHGFDQLKILALADNPEIYSAEGLVPVFDMTEERDTCDAVNLLQPFFQH